MRTPFFPAWRARLAAFGRQARTVRQQPLPQLEKVLGHLIPPGLLTPPATGTNSRHRLYDLPCTFWAFLWQALNPACPCREVVRLLQALFCLRQRAGAAEGTSAYCQARDRLPLSTLQHIRVAVAAQAQKLLPQARERWHGFVVKVADGTTLGLPDTRKNQRAYPQSSSQKPGCGFPFMKLVGLFSLSTGALLGHVTGNKHHGELPLFARLWDWLKPGDLLLADRGFASYVVLALLEQRSVACLFRLHQARPSDLRNGIRLGRNDRLCVWSKPAQKPRWLPPRLWKKVPQELVVRVLRVQASVPGFRTQTMTLLTTLTDAEAFPARELALLYLRRWSIELWWRNLKTSMGMETLRCLTPAMAHKELEMYLIAYNLIRCLLVEAGAVHDRPIERFSFKGAADALRQFTPLVAQARAGKRRRALIRKLLAALAGDLVPDRPGRREPRALKRRPKPYPLLTNPRHQFVEIPHRNAYRKPPGTKAK
jgi:hypothetical protein